MSQCLVVEFAVECAEAFLVAGVPYDLERMQILLGAPFYERPHVTLLVFGQQKHVSPLKHIILEKLADLACQSIHSPLLG